MTSLSDASTAVVPSDHIVRTPRKAREWTPHIWEGSDFFAWMRLLADNRFAVHWSKWYVAAIVTPASIFNSTLRFFQDLFIGRRVRRTPITHPPLFILGHWRTGTTHLHELLIQDPRHAYPTTYQCMAPGHFLISEAVLPKVFFFFVPNRRPMDNMAAGWDRPQEDEFALCLMGAPSPYSRLAFPNRWEKGQGVQGLLSLPRSLRRRWEQHFSRIIRQLNYRNSGRRMILKSPPHTSRMAHIRRIFPDARFVHIVRDPYVVFPSTMNLWKTLSSKHGLQRPTFAGLEEMVFRDFSRMYECFEADKRDVDDSRLKEVRYEDLVRDPLGQLEAIYRQLELGDFEPARLPVSNYLATLRNYETNRYQLSDRERSAITQRWGEVIRRYGYG